MRFCFCSSSGNWWAANVAVIKNKKKALFCRNSPFIPEYKRNSKSAERLTVADSHISFVSDSRPVNICSLSVWCPSAGLFNVQACLDNKKKPVGTLNKARPSAGAWNNKQTPPMRCLHPPLLTQSLFTGSRLNTGNWRSGCTGRVITEGINCAVNLQDCGLHPCAVVAQLLILKRQGLY